MPQLTKGIGKYSEVNKKVIWGSRAHGGHTCCKKCGTTEIRHKGGGLCVKCYDKSRATTRKRKTQLKAQHDRWYERVKGTPEYVKYVNERALVWSKTPLGRGAIYRRNQKLRLKKYLENGRVKKDYITIICSCCMGRFAAPFKEKDLPDKEGWLMLYRKLLAEKHAQA